MTGVRPAPADGAGGTGDGAGSGAAEGTAPSGRGGAATVRGGWFGFAGSAVNALFGFALVAVVTRGLGAHGAGAVFAGVAAFTIVSNACKLGADTALVRFVSRDLELTGGAGVPALLRTAVPPALAASAAATAAVLLAPGWAAWLLPGLPDGQAALVLRLFAVFLPVTTVSLVLLGATRGYGSVVPFVGVEQIGRPVLRVAIALPVALLAPGVVALSAAWLAPALPAAAVAWLALRRARAAHPGTPRTPPVTPGEFWSFAGPRALSSVFDIAAVWIGVVLLSALGTSAEAGVYTAIGRLVTAGTLLQLAVRLAVAAQLSRLLAGGRRPEAERLHQLSTRWIVLFSWPLFVYLAAFPRTVLSLFGEGFDEGAAGLVVLAAACAVNVGVGNAQTVILMAGRSVWNLAVAGAGFAVQLGLGIWLVPRYGVAGAAVAWGLAIVVDNVASALLVRHRLGFRTVDRGYLCAAAVAFAAVAPAVLGVRLAGGDTVPAASLGMALTVCAFTVTVWRYRVPLGTGEFFRALRKGGKGNSR
ncbi:polysaccharide biosynthesis C-terminal domain-containing protein [Streptomyces sp. TRM 70361]|uniref:lipopolysaccharide biosynthesis protein n=1 Tax=Streptomyces sp. TRM 70361 TaxID=3116553 RepID=UPI002E7B8470|nr:polysaccharide biosynthesis C-terminal domain-containing protein [Streptomyces sp. TRM 70361]MEE1940350.1 polysaccharide biosynthesis C-terminal domain-containing protein [Streptomyces sp. TRM 70361]